MGILLPTLDDSHSGKNREMIGYFGGYNHNARINNNEFYDMQNMASDQSRLLAPRKQRGYVRTLDWYWNRFNGLYAHEKLCWVIGTDFYYGGVKKGTVTNGPKQLIGMGAYVLIFPDKKYYNTSTGEFGSLSAGPYQLQPAYAMLCTVDGVPYGRTLSDYTIADAPPQNPDDGQLWIDTSNTPHVLKKYSETESMWISIPTTYVAIFGISSDFSNFSKYDGVTLTTKSTVDGTIDALTGDFILYNVKPDGGTIITPNYIVVAAMIDGILTNNLIVTIERKVPDMDYVTEFNNRIWGCNSEKHEIYACALGDPKNWNRYLGISTDSYAATVGTPGDFTGCIAHGGYVLFFKEDVIHKLYGNKPSNFQLQDTICRGVQKGSEKSLVIVNETLFYKSTQDVCIYNSALPTSISQALGEVKYHDASAGAVGSKYYISMKDENDQPSVFVFDETQGVWHKEDNAYVPYFAALGTELYFVRSNVNGYPSLWTVNGTLDDDYVDPTFGRPEGDFDWYAETGDIGIDNPDNKYVSKLQIRLEVDEHALVRIEVKYDNEGDWLEKYKINLTRKRSFTVPIIPRRCDTMKLRISGRGACRIYSITKTLEQGSEM